MAVGKVCKEGKSQSTLLCMLHVSQKTYTLGHAITPTGTHIYPNG